MGAFIGLLILQGTCLIGLLLAVPVAAVIVTLVDELTPPDASLAASHPEDS